MQCLYYNYSEERRNIEMKRILIISPNYQEDKCYEWINEAQKISPSCGEVSFDYISPQDQISENVTLQDCLAIKGMLSSADLREYEGLILLHGTEYIPFTAAALNLLLSHLKIPLVIITQNALLGQKASYRIECFNASVCFILSVQIPGIFSITKNEWSNTIEVHFGPRISQHAPFDFRYIDVGSRRFGDIIDSAFHFHHAAANPTPKELKSAPRIRSTMNKSANVMFIRSYRRMPYHYYNFGQYKPDAVLQELFDIPTVLNNEGLTSLIAFSEHCRHYDTPLYLCPLVDEKLDYEKVFAPVLNNGAVLIRNTTVFTAYAKLVYGYGDRRFREYLNHNYVFEDITNIL